MTNVIKRIVIFTIIILIFSVFYFLGNFQRSQSFLFESRYLRKSEVNGLYYAKQNDGKADIYSTAYSNAILSILGERFNNKTYEWVLQHRQDDGSFKFDIGLNNPIYSCYLGSLAVNKNHLNDNSIKSFLYQYKHQDGSFFYFEDKEKNHKEDLFNKKIALTYMAMYTLNKHGIEKEKLLHTYNWATTNISEICQNKLTHENLLAVANLLKIIELRDSHQNTKWPHQVDSKRIVDKLINKMSWDIDDINLLDAITTLYKHGITNIDKNQQEKIKSQCMEFLSKNPSDKQTLLQLLNTYLILNNNKIDKGLNYLKERIKNDELVSGGVGSTLHIGTPRETLMALVVLQAEGGRREDSDLSLALKIAFDNFLMGEGKNLDNADIYSLIACLKLTNQTDLVDAKKNIIIQRMKPFLTCSLNNNTFREWFYAVKALELVNYKFRRTELPVNLKNFTENSPQDSLLNSELMLNEVFVALLIDGLNSIIPADNLLQKYRSNLLSLVKTPETDNLVLKKRYYSSIALYSQGETPENLNETLKIANKLKFNSGYKAFWDAEESDLQSTFQVTNLNLMQKGKENELYR